MSALEKFTENLAGAQLQINQKIKDIIEDEILEVRQEVGALKPYFDEITPYLNGGKRIRGTLVYYSYLLHSESEESDPDAKGSANQAWTLATVIELIHAFLLIHDDIIDRDELRRDVATVHKTYQDIHSFQEYKGDSYHYGISQAIIMGDVLQNLAFELITSLKLPAESKIELMRVLSRLVIKTGYGEMLDVLLSVEGQGSENEVLQVLEYKTALYTFEIPLKMGAIAAGIKSKQAFKTIEHFSHNLGLAFQIQDDILGTFGKSETTGKAIDSDIKEGKQTLLTSFAMSEGSAEQKALLRAGLGNPNLSKGLFKQIQQVIIDTGSLTHSQNKVIAYLESAESILKTEKNWQGPGAEFLVGLIEYLQARQS